jgi:hypothetical protein
MPKARRQFKGVQPPAIPKKRFDYDVAEPKASDAKEAKAGEPKAGETAAGKGKK